MFTFKYITFLGAMMSRIFIFRTLRSSVCRANLQEDQWFSKVHSAHIIYSHCVSLRNFNFLSLPCGHTNIHFQSFGKPLRTLLSRYIILQIILPRIIIFLKILFTFSKTALIVQDWCFPNWTRRFITKQVEIYFKATRRFLLKLISNNGNIFPGWAVPCTHTVMPGV